MPSISARACAELQVSPADLKSLSLWSRPRRAAARPPARAKPELHDPTALYRAEGCVSIRMMTPEEMPSIAGPAVVFARRVWF